MGNTYFYKGDISKAIRYYQKAIETGANYIKTDINEFKKKALRDISRKIVFILQNDKSLTINKIQHFEKLIEEDYGMPDELKISYLMLQTYRRYVLEKDKRAIYELPKEQREFFLREIVGEA